MRVKPNYVKMVTNHFEDFNDWVSSLNYYMHYYIKDV